MNQLFPSQKKIVDLNAIFEKVVKIFTDDNDDEPPPPAVSAHQWLKHAEAA